MAPKRGWLQRAIADARDLTGALRAAANTGSAPPLGSAPNGGQPARLEPAAVAAALAEALKENNNVTQMIAIRANNLATLYPNKAA